MNDRALMFRRPWLFAALVLAAGVVAFFIPALLRVG